MDREALSRKLEKRRSELEQPSPSGEADRAPVELDQTSVGRLSRMDAMQVQAMAVASDQRRRSELYRIDAAIERLRTDDYGFCDICGEEIAPARLENDPAVTRCIACAR